jgi:hypothetical protein
MYDASVKFTYKLIPLLIKFQVFCGLNLHLKSWIYLQRNKETTFFELIFLIHLLFGLYAPMSDSFFWGKK